MDGDIVRLRDRSYGFIRPDDGGKDVFFHTRHLLDGESSEQLKEGERVSFDILEGEKGPIAINVATPRTIIGGKWSATRLTPVTAAAAIIARSLVTKAEVLTPELISHLKSHNDDIDSVAPEVLEHLVAELMAGVGWRDVRLVGRNPQTHADILAIHYLPGPSPIPVRYFVEVKRWKDKIGIEVFDAVQGAMVNERWRHGWHGALIVSLKGVKRIKRSSLNEMRALGIEVRSKQDLLRWLVDYKANADGLWVPPNFSSHLT